MVWTSTPSPRTSPCCVCGCCWPSKQDKPVPLPNLDFKIETGDSLLAPDPQEMPDPSEGLLQASADVLAMVKSRFFSSHGKEKEEYRRTIISQESRLRKELAAEYGEGVVDWRIQFAEAFANKRGGFDIVLANPPYVRQELLGREYKEGGLKPVYPAVYAGTADLYVYFYACAQQLLRQHGIGCFISSDKWIRTAYGEKLRQLLLDKQAFRLVVDFGELPVFDAASNISWHFRLAETTATHTSYPALQLSKILGCVMGRG